MLSVGPKPMNLDTGLLSLFQKQRRCGLRQTLRYCGNSRLMITSGKTRVSQSASCLFDEEWSDLFGNTRDNITAYVNFNQSKDTGLTTTKMTRNDELLRHLIPDSEWPRFLQATVEEWTAVQDTSAITIISPTATRDIRKHFPHRIVPSTVRSLVKELGLLQKRHVDGVFLVIVTQTYATLNDLLQHHKHLQYILSCLLRQFSNVRSLLEISSDQEANCMRVFHLEAFRFLMERGSRKVP